MQHLVLMSDDICRTLQEMRWRSGVGRFEFITSPLPTYYRNMKKKAGNVLTDDQIKECEDLGILVDKDDQGTLLQILTKPLDDRYARNPYMLLFTLFVFSFCFLFQLNDIYCFRKF